MLDGCCEQIDTKLALSQLSPSPVCVSRLFFWQLQTQQILVGSVLFTGKMCLQTFASDLKMQI